jgi:protein-tyrosine phosphatase
VYHVEILAKLGFTNIISLLETDHPTEFIEECKKYNMVVSHFHTDDKTPPTLDNLDKILEIIFSSQKTIVHCLGE